MSRTAVSVPHFLPEYRGGDGLWSPLWYCAIPYGRANEIRAQLLRTGAQRHDVRLRYIGSAPNERGSL